MDVKVHRYLESLRRHAEKVTVPTLSVRVTPLPLEQIFVRRGVGLPQQRRARDQAPQTQAAEAGSQTTGSADDREAIPQSTLQVLEREHQLVILGDAGQGKSTLLKQYAIHLTEPGREKRLPLLIELGQMRQRVKPLSPRLEWLRDRLPEQVTTAVDPALWDHLVRQIRDGGVVLLLDGFDELSEDGQGQLTNVLDAVAGNQVVLTSRPNVSRLGSLPPRFARYQLQPLQPDQIRALGKKFCEAIAAQSRRDHGPAFRRLLKVVQGPAGTMASSPLLLSFMSLTAFERYDEGNFPTRPVPLIDACLESLVRWQRGKPNAAWPTDLTPIDVRSILAPLALETFRRKDAEIRQEDVAGLGEPIKKKVLDHLLPAGFIDPEERHYRFPLPTFREYFAARAIANEADPFSELKHHLHDPAWENVVLYTAGCLEDTLQRVLNGPLPRWGAAIDLYLPTLSWVLVKTIGPLITIVGILVGFAFSRGKKKDVGDVGKDIAQGIRAWSPDIQGFLQTWFARSRHSGEFFITAILRHRCSFERILGRNRRLALRCLGQTSGCSGRLVERLVDSAAEKGEKYTYRDQARAFAEALERAAACPQVKTRLMGLTEASQPSSVRVGATIALRAVAFEEDVQDRLLHLIKDPESGVGDAASEALQAAAANASLAQELIRLAHSTTDDVRRRAISGMKGGVSLPEVRAALVELASGPGGGYALYALEGAAKDPAVEPHVLALLKGSRDDFVRSAAAYLLGKSVSDSGEVVEALLATTNDPVGTVRCRAVEALETVAKEARVWRRLLEMLDERAPPEPLFELWNSKLAAGHALCRSCSDPEVLARLLDPLLKLTGSPDPATRASAARALSQGITKPQVPRRLLELTRDPAPTVRAGAAAALRDARSNAEVQNRLLELTRDRIFQVRVYARDALSGTPLRAVGTNVLALHLQLWLDLLPPKLGGIPLSLLVVWLLMLPSLVLLLLTFLVVVLRPFQRWVVLCVCLLVLFALLVQFRTGPRRMKAEHPDDSWEIAQFLLEAQEAERKPASA